MPRRIIKRFMPDEEKIKDHPYLRRLGHFLHDPNLWHLNRKSVSLAFLVGVFCAFIPLPLQMLMAAALAILVRSNLPVSIGLVWITNPLTIPPIFYFSYCVGTFLLGTESEHIGAEFSVEWLAESVSHIWAPLLLGSLVCGVVFSVLSYFLVRYLWLLHVIQLWKQRQQKRAARKATKP